MNSILGFIFLQAVNVGKDIPLPLPLPEWLLVVLLIVSFLAHILFINLMVGGTLLCLFFEFLGIKNDDYFKLSKEIAATITVNKSLAIVMGVAPLLIINTLYTKFFYSANALTGLVWIMVIPLVTIALMAQLAEAKNNKTAQKEEVVEVTGASIWDTKCSVCHAKDKKLVGPPVLEMQEIYAKDKAGLIKWIKAPGKKREGYPQMPGFEGQISEADLEKIADFVLQMK